MKQACLPRLTPLLCGIFARAFRLGSWSQLKSVGNSYVSIVTVVVPIFGYVLLSANFSVAAIASGLEVLDTWGIQPPNLGGDGLIRLKMSYVGLSIVGLTTIAFQIACPAEIKAYVDNNDFTLQSINVAYSDALAALADRLNKGRWYHELIHPDISSKVNFKDSYQGKNPSVKARISVDAQLNRGVWLDKNTDHLNKAFYLAYEWQNYSLMLLRWIILLGFTTGYLLTLVPSLYMLSGPLTDVFRHLIN